MWPTLLKRSVSRRLVTTTMSSTSKHKSLLDKGSWLASATPSIRTKVTNKNKKMVIDWDTGCQDTRGILQPEKGKIFDKKPFTMKCEKGKSYLWCTCGWSHTQPFCDSTHKNTHMRIKLYPVRFIAPETKEYTFCNCKQTSKRPFCDGTHLREDIQAAIK